MPAGCIYVNDRMIDLMGDMLEEWDNVDVELRLMAAKDFIPRSIYTIRLLLHALEEGWELDPAYMMGDMSHIMSYAAYTNEPETGLASEGETALEAIVNLEETMELHDMAMGDCDNCDNYSACYPDQYEEEEEEG